MTARAAAARIATVIRARLAAAHDARVSGDVATARRLMAEGNLEAFVAEGFGPVPSSGIPYDRGAGAPGVERHARWPPSWCR